MAASVYAGQGRFAAGEVLINLRNSSTQRWAGTSRRPAAAVRTHSAIASGDSNAVRMRTASACADPSAEESVRPVGDELRLASTASRSPARPLPSPTRSRRWARPPRRHEQGVSHRQQLRGRISVARQRERLRAVDPLDQSSIRRCSREMPGTISAASGQMWCRIAAAQTAWNCPPCREGGDSVSITRPPAGKPSRGDPSFHAPPDLGEVHAGPNPRRRAIGQPASTSRALHGPLVQIRSGMPCSAARDQRPARALPPGADDSNRGTCRLPIAAAEAAGPTR